MGPLESTFGQLLGFVTLVLFRLASACTALRVAMSPKAKRAVKTAIAIAAEPADAPVVPITDHINTEYFLEITNALSVIKQKIKGVEKSPGTTDPERRVSG